MGVSSVYNSDEPAILSSQVAGVRSRRIDPKFLACFIDSSFFYDAIKPHFFGSTRDNISPNHIRLTSIPFPPLPIQCKIAAILGAYDDLIENNTRRIGILEEMARAIYREWFIEFRFPGHEGLEMVESELGLIPQGWEVGKLGDAIENIKEKVKPGKHLEPLPYVPIDCIPRRSIGLVEYKPSSEAKSSLIAFKKMTFCLGPCDLIFTKLFLLPLMVLPDKPVLF